MTSPREVERDLARYYDAEAGDRSGRALDPERITRRQEFVSSLPRHCRLLEIGMRSGR